MAVQEQVEFEHILDQIKSALLDNESPMHIKNARKYSVSANGTVLLDSTNKADMEWYEDDEDSKF